LKRVLTALMMISSKDEPLSRDPSWLNK